MGWDGRRGTGEAEVDGRDGRRPDVDPHAEQESSSMGKIVYCLLCSRSAVERVGMGMLGVGRAMGDRWMDAGGV